jgi:hypothetical protein
LPSSSAVNATIKLLWHRVEGTLIEEASQADVLPEPRVGRRSESMPPHPLVLSD